MICPHCGSKIDDAKLDSNVCPYCGGSLKTDNLPKYDCVLPFTVSENKAKKAVVKDLFDEGNVSIHLFDTLVSPNQITAYKSYIPMWMFKGQYTLNWKCVKVVSKLKEEYEGFRPTWAVVEHYPFSGSDHGDYCYAVSANTSWSIFSYGEIVTNGNAQANIDSSVRIEKCNISRDKAFKGKILTSLIKDKAEELLKSAVDKQEYTKGRIKEECDSVSYGYDYNYDESKLVLLPVWILVYDYDGKDYVYIVNGNNGGVMLSEYPEKEASEEIEDGVDISDIKKPMTIMGYMWLYLLISAFEILFAFVSFGKYGVWQGAIVSVIAAAFGICIIIKTSLRQDKQEQLRRDLINRRMEQSESDNGLNLRSKPLYQSVFKTRKVISKTLDTDSSSYNSKVTREKVALRMNLLVIILLLILSLGASFFFSKVNGRYRAEKYLSEQSMQSEFSVDSISYRVLSYDEKTVEVTSGKDCKGKVVIPSKVTNGRNEYTVIQIGKEAFAGNREIASVTLPNTVVSILDAAFSGCNLASFTPSENLTYVSGTAFSNVLNMGAYLPVGAQNGMIYLGKVAYCYVGDTEHLTNYTIREGTVSIADGVFQNCRELTTVRLPNSLRSIGIKAFGECESLESIIIPRDVEYIGREAFKHCYNLASITLYNNIEVIGQQAFDDTEWYKNIIGEKDYYHYDYAVADTTATDSDDYEVAPTNVETDNGNYSIDGNFVYIGSVLYGTKKEVPYGTSLAVKEGTKGIAEYAFNNCNGLVSVSLPSSIMCVGEGAFQNCKGLERVNIPKRLKKVGKHSFEGCVSLKEEELLGDNIPCIGLFSDYVKRSK